MTEENNLRKTKKNLKPSGYCWREGCYLKPHWLKKFLPPKKVEAKRLNVPYIKSKSYGKHKLSFLNFPRTAQESRSYVWSGCKVAEEKQWLQAGDHDLVSRSARMLGGFYKTWISNIQDLAVQCITHIPSFILKMENLLHPKHYVQSTLEREEQMLNGVSVLPSLGSRTNCIVREPTLTSKNFIFSTQYLGNFSHSGGEGWQKSWPVERNRCF